MFYLATINVSHSYIKSERLIDQYDQCGKNTVVIVSVLFVKCTVLFGFMISFVVFFLYFLVNYCCSIRRAKCALKPLSNGSALHILN